MHELSIVMEVVKTVEGYAAKNEVGRVEKIVLEIGDLSSVVPHYVEQVYPAAVKGTVLENALLEIEKITGKAECRSCGEVFNVREHRAVCPACGGKEVKLLCGRECNIKEIAVASD